MQLRERGIAMIITLMTMVIVVGIGTLLFARTINEMRHSRDDAAIVQTLLLARGGANLGNATLSGPVKEALNAIVEASSSTTRAWSFGDGAYGAEQPDPDEVADDLGTVAAMLQDDIDALVCGEDIVPTDTQAVVTLRIHVSAQACGTGLPSGVKLPSGRFVRGAKRPAPQDYAVPFVMVAEASLGEYKRNVVLQGEYRFTVGRPSFAQYALFTNQHTTQDGSDIWFTEDTLFDGPVHSNEYFRFYRNPWFGGRVTSAGCTQIGTRYNAVTGQNEDYCRRNNRQGAEFYAEGFVRYDRLNSQTNPSYRNRYGTHAPELTAGVEWTSDFIPLPQNALDQQEAAEEGGLYFDEELYSLKVWAADGAGNPLEGDGNGGWEPAASYQYIQGCTSDRNDSCSTYRYGSDGNLYRQSSDSWQLVRTAFNGVLFVAGEVDRFSGPVRSPSWSSDPDDAPPALASFAQLTLAAEERVRITGDLKYEEPPCSSTPTRQNNGTVTPADCGNLSARNVLGVYVQDEDILIGNNSSGLNAPDNVSIHGVLMSGEGVVGVEDFRSGSSRGAVNLIGGIIENYYGGFGTFNSRTGTQSTGYSRKFTYDQRMYSDLSPPYFPTIGKDGVQGVIPFSFGQREQLY